MCLAHMPREGFYAIAIEGLQGMDNPIATFKTFYLVHRENYKELITEILMAEVKLQRNSGLLFLAEESAKPTRQSVEYILPIKHAKMRYNSVTTDADLAVHTALFHNKLTAESISVSPYDGFKQLITVPTLVPMESIMAVGINAVVSSTYALFTEETIDLFEQAAKRARMKRAVRETFVKNALYVERMLGI